MYLNGDVDDESCFQWVHICMMDVGTIFEENMH